MAHLSPLPGISKVQKDIKKPMVLYREDRVTVPAECHSPGSMKGKRNLEKPQTTRSESSLQSMHGDNEAKSFHRGIRMVSKVIPSIASSVQSERTIHRSIAKALSQHHISIKFLTKVIQSFSAISLRSDSKSTKMFACVLVAGEVKQVPWTGAFSFRLPSTFLHSTLSAAIMHLRTPLACKCQLHRDFQSS